jgi:predicted MFS family arabinose efflux permease
MRLVMRSPQLRRIVVAYTINRLGGWFGLLALVLAVYDHTHSALAVSALMFGSLALPALVVPAVVAKVEASQRRRELSALYLFEALMTAGLAVLLWNFSLPAILVLVTLDGIAALAASALLRSEVARAARDWVEQESASGTAEDELDASVEEAERHANAALNLGFSMSFILGPALGGLVVAAAGAPAALFIDVGSFLACGLLLLDLHPHVENAGGDSVRARLRDAREHVLASPMLKRLFLTELLALTFIETGAPIEVQYVKSTLAAGDRGVGVLLAMWGAGGILGSIVFARLVKWPLGVLLGAGTLCIAGAYLGLAAAPSLGLACLAGLLGGIGNGLQWPSLISAVQKLTPAAMQGRMMGAAESLGALCVAIGLPLGGGLASALSPRTAFWLVGSGAALATLALLRVRIPATGSHEALSAAPAQGGAEGLSDAADRSRRPERVPN